MYETTEEAQVKARSTTNSFEDILCACIIFSVNIACNISPQNLTRKFKMLQLTVKAIMAAEQVQLTGRMA